MRRDKTVCSCLFYTMRHYPSITAANVRLPPPLFLFLSSTIFVALYLHYKTYKGFLFLSVFLHNSDFIFPVMVCAQVFCFYFCCN